MSNTLYKHQKNDVPNPNLRLLPDDARYDVVSAPGFCSYVEKYDYLRIIRVPMWAYDKIICT